MALFDKKETEVAEDILPIEKGVPVQTDNSVRPEDGDQPASFEEALAAIVWDDDDEFWDEDEEGEE